MAESRRGFELAEAYAETFAGGSAALPNDRSVDYAELLEQGNGRIVTDDPDLIANLEANEAFRRAPAEPVKRQRSSSSSSGGKGDS